MDEVVNNVNNKVLSPNFDPNFDPNQVTQNKYWKQIKEFGLAGLSAATGDPEAMKTIVDVLANATHLGLEKVKLQDQSKTEIKKKLTEAIDSGADGLLKALSWYQKNAAESNVNLRKRYGRTYNGRNQKKA